MRVAERIDRDATAEIVKKINDNGSLTDTNNALAGPRANCPADGSGWRPAVRCAADELATAAEIHFGPGSDERDSLYDAMNRGELPPGIAADEYDQALTGVALDFVLLGLGSDGHMASLFPGSPALAERERWVVAPWVEKFSTFRITLTPPVLNRAAAVLFLAAGEEKADALHADSTFASESAAMGSG